ncbi:MAG: electron transfer flavoprotein subunit alpha/FixB family protein [Magnetococcales bacterium]|nr:electron transfer flavoprotein subunit alpha/FixB family protein [Magnetococcales bacterium]
MKVLLVIGDRLGEYDPLTVNGVAAGLHFGDVTVLAAGPNSQKKADKAAQINGVKEVLLATHPTLQKPSVENLAMLVNELTPSFDIILAVTSTFGSDLIPRVAALANSSPITGVWAIAKDHTLTRPINAGAVLAQLNLPKPPVFLTIRPTAFPANFISNNTRKAKITVIDKSYECNLSQHKTYTPSANVRPDPVSAKIVVAGGGGLQAGGSFELVEKLADRLNAAVGASRTAVDMGLASNDLQIGQTGRCIAPDLYIALGISGAIQHLAGIKDARMIVSINSDPNAPLHGAADFALTADIFSAVPELLKK